VKDGPDRRGLSFADDERRGSMGQSELPDEA
jgi:hypothetical protein